MNPYPYYRKKLKAVRRSIYNRLSRGRQPANSLTSLEALALSREPSTSSASTSTPIESNQRTSPPKLRKRYSHSIDALLSNVENQTKKVKTLSARSTSLASTPLPSPSAQALASMHELVNRIPVSLPNPTPIENRPIQAPNPVILTEQQRNFLYAQYLRNQMGNKASVSSAPSNNYSLESLTNSATSSNSTLSSQNSIPILQANNIYQLLNLTQQAAAFNSVPFMPLTPAMLTNPTTSLDSLIMAWRIQAAMNEISINQQIQTNASMPHQVFCPINQQIRSTAPITTQAQPLTNVIVNGKACGKSGPKGKVISMGSTSQLTLEQQVRSCQPSSSRNIQESNSPPEPVENPNLEVELNCEWSGCNSLCTSMRSFVAHVTTHINMQSNNVCKWKDCDRKLKPFSAHYMLVLHVRKHTQEKPNQCTMCNKAYSRLENLKTHIRTHTGEKPYKCEFAGCDRAFTNASDRAKHQNRTHSDVKPYVCPVENCNSAYTDPSSLRKHIKTKHGDHIYDEAKENKARNGRGGNYGFIPASRVNRPVDATYQARSVSQPSNQSTVTTNSPSNDSGHSSPGSDENQSNNTMNGHSLNQALPYHNEVVQKFAGFKIRQPHLSDTTDSILSKLIPRDHLSVDLPDENGNIVGMRSIASVLHESSFIGSTDFPYSGPDDEPEESIFNFSEGPNCPRVKQTKKKSKCEVCHNVCSCHIKNEK